MADIRTEPMPIEDTREGSVAFSITLPCYISGMAPPNLVLQTFASALDGGLRGIEYTNELCRQMSGNCEISSPNPNLVPSQLANGVFSYTFHDGASRFSQSAPIFITSTELINKTQNGNTWRLNWMMATDDTLEAKSKAYPGDCIAATEALLEDHGYAMNNKTGVETTGYNIVYRIGMLNMWSALEYIFEHSSYKADYMFWAFNEWTGEIDVGRMFKALNDTGAYIFDETSGNRLAGEFATIQRIPDSDHYIWSFNRDSYSDVAGGSFQDARPSIVLSNVDMNGQILHTNGADYGWVSKYTGARLDKDKHSKFLGTNRVFGQSPSIRRMNPACMFSDYLLCPDARRLTLDRFSKHLVLNISDHIGPPLGSTIAARCLPDNTGSSYESSNLSHDPIKSDFYVLRAKQVKWRRNTEANLNNPEEQSSEVHAETRLMCVGVSSFGDSLEEKGALENVNNLIREALKENLPA